MSARRRDDDTNYDDVNMDMSEVIFTLKNIKNILDNQLVQKVVIKAIVHLVLSYNSILVCSIHNIYLYISLK